MLSLELVIPYLWTKQLQKAEEVHVFLPLPEVGELDAFCPIHFTSLYESCVSSIFSHPLLKDSFLQQMDAILSDAFIVDFCAVYNIRMSDSPPKTSFECCQSVFLKQ